MLTKHVDDLKFTGNRAEVLAILAEIQKVFGELKIIWNDFTNCGVHNFQDPITKEITLDQTAYLSALKAIVHSAIQSMKSDEFAPPDLHELYRSLLGAVAFTSLTRIDAVVFICALQRWSHQPQIIHVKRLNALLRWMQACPKKLKYSRMASGIGHLRGIGDAAFKKEEEKGFSLRGAVFVRMAGSTVDDFVKSGVCHILDFQSKAQRHVTRSTFAAELFGGCDTLDHLLLLALMLHEIECGPVTKVEGRALREYGGYAVPMALYLDALSVFAACTAVNIKVPAEKSLLSHVQFIRECLDNHVLAALLWLDTRDMTADGLTKGAVERTLLHVLMNGILRIEHELKIWASKRQRPAISPVDE